MDGEKKGCLWLLAFCTTVWGYLTLISGVGWELLGALILLFLGLFGLFAWQTRRHRARQVFKAHSVTVEAQEEGGYKVVE